MKKPRSPTTTAPLHGLTVQTSRGRGPNPVVAESLLDRLINAGHQVIMNGPKYRPNKRPKGPTGKPDTSASG